MKGGAGRSSGKSMLLSVVIPTLDEETVLASTLDSVRRSAPASEIVVADGGSRDATREIARLLPRSAHGRGPAGSGTADERRGRSRDRRRAAVPARGHPPARGRRRSWWSRPSPTPGWWGAASCSASTPLTPCCACPPIASRLNLRWATYGDQAFFFRREAFERAGGFPSQPLFEDVAMQARIRRLGRCVKIQRRVTSSARRFLRVGVLRQQLLNAAPGARLSPGRLSPAAGHLVRAGAAPPR